MRRAILAAVLAVWTGLDLKAQRVRRGLRAADVAAAIGLSRQRISQIEAAARPSHRDIDRYWIALARLSQPVSR
jgi:transcriptional regulator with XRE-family HTH domain